MALLAIPVMALGALMFATLGMLYTAFVTSIEHFNFFYSGVLTPMFLFGGVFFPFDALPLWARVVGWCLPLSHLSQALRDLSLDRVGWMTALHVAVMAAVTAVVFPVPLVRLRARLIA
ncbi:MAG: ABC transporter permease [Thermoleophilia bacterium]